mgnify:CR=1 FL=1
MIDSKQFIIMDVPFEKEDFLHITLSNGKICLITKIFT